MKLSARSLQTMVRAIHPLVRRKAEGIYASIRLTTSEEALLAQGGNEAVQVLTWAGAREGSVNAFDVMVPEDRLYSCVGSLDGDVTLKPKGNRLEVRCGRSRIQLPTASVEFALPQPTWDPQVPAIHIPGEEFKEMLRRTLFSVAKKAIGAHVAPGPILETDGDQFRVFATDGYMLSSYSVKMHSPQGYQQITVPVESLQVAERMITDDEAGVWMQLACESHLVVRSGDMICSAVPFHYQPPELHSMALERAAGTWMAIVSIGELIRALKASEAVVAKDESKTCLLHVEEGLLVVQGTSVNSGRSSVSMDCEYDGQPQDIRVDSTQLRECLERLKQELVGLEIPSDTDETCYVRLVEGNGASLVRLFHMAEHEYNPELEAD